MSLQAKASRNAKVKHLERSSNWLCQFIVNFEAIQATTKAKAIPLAKLSAKALTPVVLEFKRSNPWINPIGNTVYFINSYYSYFSNLTKTWLLFRVDKQGNLVLQNESQETIKTWIKQANKAWQVKETDIGYVSRIKRTGVTRKVLI